MASQTTEEELHWQNWVNSRDPQAGNFLMKKYMPLVSYHVQRISAGIPRNAANDDLRSLGMIGLYDALEKFDPDRDLKFDTYASFRIRGTILDGLRKEDWLPRSTREKIKKVESAIEKLEQRLMRNATIHEISAELNVSEEEVYSVINEQFFAKILSIDDSIINENDENEGKNYFIKDRKVDIPEEKVIKDELIREIAELISQLNEKEQLVISLFYKEELTLTEIGQVMNLSTSRVSQIHSKAIFKLRQVLNREEVPIKQDKKG